MHKDAKDGLNKTGQQITPIMGDNKDALLDVISEKTVVQVEPAESVYRAELNEKTMMLGDLSNTGNNVSNHNEIADMERGQKSDAYSAGVNADTHSQVMTQNMLVSCAMPLIHQAMSLSSSADFDDIQDVRSRLISDMRRFQNKAEQCISDQRHIVAARYLLCSFVDEIIATTPWGLSHRWGAESLLSYFHNETYGGDGFFTLLERAMQQPQQYLDLLELMYVCLSLGFSGRYRVDPNGLTKLESIRESMMTTISAHQAPDNRGMLVGNIHRQTEPKKRAKWLGPIVISTLLLGNAAGYWVFSNQLEVRMDTASEHAMSRMSVSS